MIVAGRVTVNGKLATLGIRARDGIDIISLDGIPISSKNTSVYIMLNKPRGYVTTMSDEYGRKTVSELVNDVNCRVYPIGRLDIASQGLLLMTNDGTFANRVAHPSHNQTKTYEAHVRVSNGLTSLFGVSKSVNEDINVAIAKMNESMSIDGHTIQAASVMLLKRTDTVFVLEIVIYEGRNRQIRKMCDICGLDVRMLKRVAVGPVKLGSLRTGKWRHLTNDEREALNESGNGIL